MAIQNSFIWTAFRCDVTTCELEGKTKEIDSGAWLPGVQLQTRQHGDDRFGGKLGAFRQLFLHSKQIRAPPVQEGNTSFDKLLLRNDHCE